MAGSGGVFERWGRFLHGLPPSAGAAAMATGVLSLAYASLGAAAVSAVFLVAACGMWLALAFGTRLRYEGERWRHEADAPAALTAVVATAVLGTRFASLGWTGVAVAFLCGAAALWPGLLMAVVRRSGRGVRGTAYLVCASTQSLSVLAATIAQVTGTGWLMWPAAALAALGLALYVAVLARFDFGEARHGAGDHWVASGALSITTLADVRLVAASAPAGALGWATGAHQALRTTGLVLGGFALVSYAVLAFCEVRWPRPGYDVRRWSTVFPLAMTALAAIDLSSAAGVGWPRTAGAVLLWIALAAWLAVALGAVRRARGAGPV